MPVSTTIRTIGYTGNGVATSFNTTFPFQEANDLAVTVAGVLKTLGVDYNVTGGGPGVASGNVVFVAAPAAAAAIVITRTTDLTQAVDFRTQGDFSTETHTNIADKLTEIVQELAARITTLEGGSTNNATAGNGLLNTAGTWSVKPDATGGGLGSPNIAVSAAGVSVVTEGDEATMNPVLSDATTPSAGGRPTPSRSDHQHTATTAAAGTAQVGDAAAIGASSALSRADHKHNFPAPGAPANITTDANTAAAGTSLKFAREDHASVLTTAAPTTISDSTSTQGTATSSVRSDHVHPHGNRGGGALHAVASSSTAGFMSAADKAKLDLITDFSNALLTTINGSGTTVDATPSTLGTQFVPVNGEGYFVELIAVGTKSDGSQAAAYKVLGAYRRVGGVTSLVGALNLLFTAEDDAAWDATLIISANNIRPQVTGKAATNIGWQVYLRVYQSP